MLARYMLWPCVCVCLSVSVTNRQAYCIETTGRIEPDFDMLSYTYLTLCCKMQGHKLIFVFSKQTFGAIVMQVFNGSV